MKPLFDPEAIVARIRGSNTTLEETKGERAVPFIFADGPRDSEAIKKIAANISKQSKSLSRTLAEIKVNTVVPGQLSVTTPEERKSPSPS